MNQSRAFLDALSRKILVMDGATGTALERMKPTASDFGGEDKEGCNEALNLFAPQIVEQLHKTYIDAGADILETNSFNGSTLVLGEYGLAQEIHEVNRRAAELAKSAIAKYASERPVFVAGAMGPTNRALSITGGTTFDALVESYRLQALGLLLGGADYLLLETQQDTVNLKAAWRGVQFAIKEFGQLVPVAISVTIETNGTMLGGQTIDALYYTVASYEPVYVGMNCATGPDKMTDHIRSLSQICHRPVACVPNAGLPNTEGEYNEGPEQFHHAFDRFLREGFLNVVGGCCGTSSEHIKVLRKLADHYSPRIPIAKANRRTLAGYEPLIIDNFIRPVFVGERTNVIGSRKFKRMVSEEKYDLAAEIGKEQVNKGAHLIDICTANPDRDEWKDFHGVLSSLLRKVRVPIMIDSTDAQVVEDALRSIPGKAIINSINFEDGEKRLELICPIAKEFGASLVFGLIDEDKEAGMAVTLERKLAIAERAYDTLVNRWGFDPGEVVFDPLVFPCGTGDPNYHGAAAATIAAVREIKTRWPDCLTVLGISNVSFGLPDAGREVLNSVFLYENVQAGLDMAIVNTAGLHRYATIPPEEIELSLNLLYERRDDAIARFAAHYRDIVQADKVDEWGHLSNDEKIAKCIVTGTKEGLTGYLDHALQSAEPLAIINGPLMVGMKEVGRLFADNKLIVAEVLESAEAMKVGVDHLKKFFAPGAKSSTRGKMLLATVKGDVHDIGKNLVDMIFSNNGYEVVNLGIKIPPDVLIQAVLEHNPDFIGLSGLLVRSAQMMVTTAQDFNAAGIDIPLIVGGAALTKKFTMTKIALEHLGPTFYAAEAMQGLELANRLTDDDERPKLFTEWKDIQQRLLASSSENEQELPPAPSGSRWEVCEIPTPPDYDEHVLTELPLDEILALINPMMLYGKHLGLKNSMARLNKPGDKQAWELQKQVEKVIDRAVHLGILRPRALYRYFLAHSVNESLYLMDAKTKQELAQIEFPRERTEPFRCASDWVRPLAQGGNDSMAMFVVNAGTEVGKLANEWMNAGELLNSHILASVAIETAEATAEWIHKKIRADWGYPDDSEMAFGDYIKCRYRGLRISFGYPACPRIEDQEILFRLLQPEHKIGVQLTDGFMMEPEASVSALVFHHPTAKYFSA
ncbi:MAG: methionine synthase [bacterium]|nr:methionine synthase [bacterium]